MQRRLLLVLTLLFLLLGSTIVIAVGVSDTVYMPVVLQAPPTLTATITPIPTATDTPTPLPTATLEPTPTPTSPPPTPTQIIRRSCTDNPPAALDGAQAWVTNARPAQNTDETVCARLLVSGTPQTNIPVVIVVHYDSGPSRYAGLTDSDGLVTTTFGIGSATHGFDVVVDVFFATLETTSTDFIPQ